MEIGGQETEQHESQRQEEQRGEQFGRRSTQKATGFGGACGRRYGGLPGEGKIVIGAGHGGGFVGVFLR